VLVLGASCPAIAASAQPISATLVALSALPGTKGLSALRTRRGRLPTCMSALRDCLLTARPGLPYKTTVLQPQPAL